MKPQLGPIEAEQSAQTLLQAASRLEAAYALVHELCQTATESILAEVSALDTLDDCAKDVAHALRSIAMRLDRGAVGKFHPDFK